MLARFRSLILLLLTIAFVACFVDISLVDWWVRGYVERCAEAGYAFFVFPITASVILFPEQW